MSDRTAPVITTSAGSWLGASIGAEIGSLVVLPIGFLVSICLRSQWMFFLTLGAWAVFTGTGGYWIRRHRYRFDLQHQTLERHTLWFFRSARVQRIGFNRISSFEVADTNHGPRLLMLLNPGGRWVIKAGSRQRLEPLRLALSELIPPHEIAGAPLAASLLVEPPIVEPTQAEASLPEVTPPPSPVDDQKVNDDPDRLIFDGVDGVIDISSATTSTAATVEAVGTIGTVVTPVTADPEFEPAVPAGHAIIAIDSFANVVISAASVIESGNLLTTMDSAERSAPASITDIADFASEVTGTNDSSSSATPVTHHGDLVMPATEVSAAAGLLIEQEGPEISAAAAAVVASELTDIAKIDIEHRDAPVAPTVMETSVVEEQNDAGIETATPAVSADTDAPPVSEPPAGEPPAVPTVFAHSDLPSSNMQQLKVGIIGGSGLGQLLGGHAGQGRRHEMHTPFGAPSDAIIETEWAGVPVFLLARHGPGHLLNPSQVPYQANIFALKQLGCTHIIASGAVGSLREEMKPRDLAIPDQIIDKTTKRPATFFDNTAVHVEFSEPFCPTLRQILVEAGSLAADAPAVTHATHDRGCYVVMEGPAFSTRAESLMHRLWGGDLIGMTAMPEAKLAREAEISYALVALVTDYDCWRQKPPTTPGQIEQKPAAPVDPFVLLKEIISNLESASGNAMALIRRAIELIASRQEELMKAPSRNALQLAIWSERSKIPADEVARLQVLWGRHFEHAHAEAS